MIYGPYQARVSDIHDGDTLGLDIDLGFAEFILSKSFDGHRLMTCRLFGINAPELTVAGHPNPDGIAARDYLATLAEPGAIVSVVSHGWDRNGGRFDGEVQLKDGTDLSEAMVQAGHAVVKDYG